jgi:hypothetical protein
MREEQQIAVSVELIHLHEMDISRFEAVNLDGCVRARQVRCSFLQCAG